MFVEGGLSYEVELIARFLKTFLGCRREQLSLRLTAKTFQSDWVIGWVGERFRHEEVRLARVFSFFSRLFLLLSV